MKKLAVILSFIFIFTTFSFADAAVKSGATCPKAGSSSIVSGKKYTCIKSGKKLVWDKGVSIQKVSPTAKPTPSPSPTEEIQLQYGPAPLNKILDPNFKKHGDLCPKGTGDVVGYNNQGLFVDLMCNDGRYTPRPSNMNPFPVDPVTGKRLDTGVQLIQPLMQDAQPQINWVLPTTNNEMPQSSITPNSDISPIQFCKIPDAGVAGDLPEFWQHHFVSGFSPYQERAKLDRSPVIQFVTIDFSDLPGKGTPSEDLAPVTDFLQKFWSSQSTDKIKLNFRIPKNYIRMPKKVSEYNLNVEFFSGNWKPENSFNYVREALSVADPTINFSDVDVIVIAVPKEVRRDQIGAFVAESSESRFENQGFQTNEKKIMNTLIMAGPGGSNAYELLNWAHELGHNFGLSDLRYAKNVSAQDSSALGVYDLMNSMIDSELLAWNRFILGILHDDQVRCVTNGTSTHLLRPVEMDTNQTKLVVIPTGKYKAIAIESRRALGFDANMGSLSEGAIVYEIDTTIEYGYSPMSLVARNGSKDSLWRRDAALKVGDSVTTSGWQITVIESGNFGDVVKVVKVA